MIKGFKFPKESREKMSKSKILNPTRYWLGKHRDEKTRIAMSKTQFKKGQTPWNFGKKFPYKAKPKYNVSIIPTTRKQFICKDCGAKVSYGNSRCRLCVPRTGSNSPTWKGGITTENEKIRKSKEYKYWRVKVFERDLFTCQRCGQIGGELHADHVMPFSLYPELRFDLLNGRTLCKECHKKTDTWSFNIIRSNEFYYANS